MARRRDSLAEDLVLLPWWFSAGLAALVYFVLPTVLPAPFKGFASLGAVFLLCLALLSALRAWKTARMLEAQSSIDSVRDLPWKRFEDLLGEAFRRQGYKVQETLGGGADGGVDLVLGRNQQVCLIQCKRWKDKPVPVQTVRELYGVLHDQGATSAKLVATTRFTPDAVAFAKGKPIELIDSEQLMDLLRAVQTSGKIVAAAVAEPEPKAVPNCPRCNSSMVLRRAGKGPNAGSEFWGCSSYPKCRGTRTA